MFHIFLDFYNKTYYNKNNNNIKRTYKGEKMEPRDYTVTKIEGEYAYLEDDTKNELFIALALLPAGIDVGTRLHYEMFEYSII